MFGSRLPARRSRSSPPRAARPPGSSSPARARADRGPAQLARGRTRGLWRSRSRSPLGRGAARLRVAGRGIDLREDGERGADGRSCPSSRPSSTASPAATYAVRQRPRSKSECASSRNASGTIASAASPTRARRAPGGRAGPTRRCGRGSMPTRRPEQVQRRLGRTRRRPPRATSARSSRSRPPRSPATEVAARNAWATSELSQRFARSVQRGEPGCRLPRQRQPAGCPPRPRPRETPPRAPDPRLPDELAPPRAASRTPLLVVAVEADPAADARAARRARGRSRVSRKALGHERRRLRP